MSCIRVFSVTFLVCLVGTFSLGCFTVSQPKVQLAKKGLNEIVITNRPPGLEYSPDFERVEDLIEYQVQRFQQSYPPMIFQDLLRQKSKFRALATACTEKKQPTERELLWVRGELSEIKITDDFYLLRFECYLYRVVSTFVLFPYSLSKGIQTTPLKFVEFEEDQTGKPVKKEVIILRDSAEYNPKTKELTIKNICDSSAFPEVKATYKFQNNEFVLSEYWRGDPYDRTCTSELKQLYP